MINFLFYLFVGVVLFLAVVGIHHIVAVIRFAKARSRIEKNLSQVERVSDTGLDLVPTEVLQDLYKEFSRELENREKVP